MESNMEVSSRSPFHKKIGFAVHRSLKLVAEEIRFLSLEKSPYARTRILSLAAKVEAAEQQGFEVGEYKEKLARLRSILDGWDEELGLAAKRWRRRRQLREEEMAARSTGQRKRLRQQMAEQDDEEERERKALRECCSTFESVATAPWPWENYREGERERAKQSMS